MYSGAFRENSSTTWGLLKNAYGNILVSISYAFHHYEGCIVTSKVCPRHVLSPPGCEFNKSPTRFKASKLNSPPAGPIFLGEGSVDLVGGVICFSLEGGESSSSLSLSLLDLKRRSDKNLFLFFSFFSGSSSSLSFFLSLTLVVTNSQL